MREPRLLVVANPYESAMIRRAAEYAGVSVSEADVEDVEAALRDADPDVAVVAAALAHGEGVGVVGRLRALRGVGSRPRLIVIGGEGTPVGSADDARRLGADDYMPRPVDLEGLVARIMRAAGRRVTGPTPLADVRSVVAARVEAEFSGALDLALGTVGESAGSSRSTRSMGAVAAASPAVAPAGRTTLRLETVAPAPSAAAPAGRTTLRLETVAPAPPAPEPDVRATVRLETVAPPAPRSLDDAELAAVRARVYALLPLVREGDYFALLGVPREATAAEVERAWHDLRSSFDPAAADPGLADDLRAALATVRCVVDEAHRVLRDDAIRRSYREHLQS